MEPALRAGCLDDLPQGDPGNRGSTLFALKYRMAESGEQHAYPRRLHHAVPTWVDGGAYFHIRIRVAQNNPRPLVYPEVAMTLLTAVQNYHERGRWQAALFLVMPDHTHALLAFPYDRSMSRITGEWKHYLERTARIKWQGNFFDHRIRNHSELLEKYFYILKNPVVKGLCSHESEWPWVWTPPAGEQNPRGARVPP